MRNGAWLLLAAVVEVFAFPAFAAIHYVDVNSTNPVAPYTNWATAAAVIQNAVDVSSSGDEVVVTDGVYETGGAVWVTGLPTNRVVVRNPMTLRSANGPGVTIIKGYQVPGTTNGTSAISCVHLASGATLSGFTLTNGATWASFSGAGIGAGVYCESGSVVVSNCIIMGNVAYYLGGGVYGGAVKNCYLSGNIAKHGGGASGSALTGCSVTSNTVTGGGYGGGLFQGTLDNCVVGGNMATYGGGAYNSPLNGCIVSGNTATSDGGGTYQGALNDCLVTSNTAAGNGGGAYNCALTNCVLVGNSASNGGGAYQYGLFTTVNCTVFGNSAGSGGGIWLQSVTPGCNFLLGNSILYFNTATNSPNLFLTAPPFRCLMSSCCMTPYLGVL